MTNQQNPPQLDFNGIGEAIQTAVDNLSGWLNEIAQMNVRYQNSYGMGMIEFADMQSYLISIDPDSFAFIDLASFIEHEADD